MTKECHHVEYMKEIHKKLSKAKYEVDRLGSYQAASSKLLPQNQQTRRATLYAPAMGRNTIYSTEAVCSIAYLLAISAKRSRIFSSLFPVQDTVSPL